MTNGEKILRLVQDEQNFDLIVREIFFFRVLSYNIMTMEIFFFRVLNYDIMTMSLSTGECSC